MTEAEKKALSSYKTPELIATYEDLYRVPEQECVTYYYGDYGGHFFKYGMAEESIRAAYEKALAAIRMSSEEFQASKDFVYRGGIIARMMDYGERKQPASGCSQSAGRQQRPLRSA